METNRYNVKGSLTIPYLEANSTSEITGLGSMNIDGPIGKGAVIITSSKFTGSVNINGTVEEGVKFKMRGCGSLNFAKKPPESVVNGIEKNITTSIYFPKNRENQTHSRSITINNNNNSTYTTQGTLKGFNFNGVVKIGNVKGRAIFHEDGLIKVIQNGKKMTYLGEETMVNNNKLYIDGSLVTDNDPRIIHVEDYDGKPINISTHALVKSSLPETKVSSVSDDYSVTTELYLNKFKGKTKHSEVIENIQLTYDEKKLLDTFLDPVTGNVINVPVILNHNVYNHQTLVDAYQKDKRDPLSGELFSLKDIQPAQSTADALDAIIQQIKESRNVSALTNNNMRQMRLS